MRTVLLIVFILSACGHQSPRALSHSDGTRITAYPPNVSMDAYSDCLSYARAACVSEECTETAISACQEFSYTGQLCQAEDLTGADAGYQHGPWCKQLECDVDPTHEHLEHVGKHGLWCWDDRAVNATSECVSPWEFIKAETNIHHGSVCDGKYWYPVMPADCEVWRHETIDRCLKLIPHGYGQWGHKTDFLYESCLLECDTASGLIGECTWTLEHGERLFEAWRDNPNRPGGLSSILEVLRSL